MASEQDIQDVIKTLIAEGVGEGQEGMRRIAETILNRAEQRGISPAEVVRQRAQYTGYSSPGPGAVRAQSDPSAISAAQAAWALAQGPDDPTGGANHYFNPNIVTPSWAKSMTPTGTYGGHAFYTDRPVMIPKVAPFPASVEDRVTARNTAPSPLQTALDALALRRRNEVTPASVEDRVTARNKSPVVPVAPVMTPSQAARRAALSIGANQTYAGQESKPASAIGKPPATRAVQSVPVSKPAAQTTNRLSGLFAAAPSDTPVSKTEPTISAPALTQQQKLAILNTAQPDDRLPSTPMAGAKALPPIFQPGTEGVATLLDTVDPTGKRVAAPIQQATAPLSQVATQSPPVPQPRIERPIQQPIQAAFTAPVQPPIMRAPLRIVVNGGNVQKPIMQAPVLTPQQAMIAAGNAAVAQSGDDSVGNQAEAAAIRASAQTYRESKAKH